MKVLHRLKLVTGVDISTRPVRRLGREGNAKKKKNLRAAAELKRITFRRSMTMFNSFKSTTQSSDIDLGKVLTALPHAKRRQAIRV